jgi:hypothetical protein
MSTVKTNNILNTGGTAGISFNTTTKNVELVSNGFNLSFDGVNIVPQGKTRIQFTYSASDQSWVVPSGITNVYVKMWAAGGGGGHYGGWSFGSHGGGGGHTRGIIPVTPGETLTIRVPRGGYANSGLSGKAPFGGGGAANDTDNQYAAGGGGYCGIFRSTTPLLIAGAGGGGGSRSGAHDMCNGGAGGGYTGRRGEAGENAPQWCGGGGTQTAGGTGGTGTSTSGAAGSYLQGGSTNGNPYGGGGGGGYYGGGAGSYQSSTMCGGGGGSGYIHSSIIMGATYTGNGRYAAGTDDIDYPASSISTYSSIGYGGTQRQHAGDGFMVIYY